MLPCVFTETVFLFVDVHYHLQLEEIIHTVLGDVGLLNVLEHIVSQGPKHPRLFPVTECGFKGQLQRDVCTHHLFLNAFHLIEQHTVIFG